MYSLSSWSYCVAKKIRRKYIQMLKVIISGLWNNYWFVCLCLFFFLYGLSFFQWKAHYLEKSQYRLAVGNSDQEPSNPVSTLEVQGQGPLPLRGAGEWVKLTEIKALLLRDSHARLCVWVPSGGVISSPCPQRCWKKLKRQSSQASLSFLEGRTDIGQNIISSSSKRGRP